MTPNLIPCLTYEDAHAAIDFLCEAFGFERHAVYEDDDGEVVHAELTYGDGMVMLGEQRETEFGRAVSTPRELGGLTHGVYVVVEEIEAHHARAKAAGADVSELTESDHGSTDYYARDLEAHLWSFGTYVPGGER